MITLVVVIALIPLVLLADLVRLWARWRRVPLAQKNHTRAGLGSAAIALAVALAVVRVPLVDPFIDPLRVWLIGGLAGFGLLYLVVGVLGSHGARFDFMSAFWWAVAAIGCVVLLAYRGGLI